MLYPLSSLVAGVYSLTVAASGATTLRQRWDENVYLVMITVVMSPV